MQQQWLHARPWWQGSFFQKQSYTKRPPNHRAAVDGNDVPD
jgi:hypothetical protein